MFGCCACCHCRCCRCCRLCRCCCSPPHGSSDSSHLDEVLEERECVSPDRRWRTSCCTFRDTNQAPSDNQQSLWSSGSTGHAAPEPQSHDQVASHCNHGQAKSMSLNRSTPKRGLLLTWQETHVITRRQRQALQASRQNPQRNSECSILRKYRRRHHQLSCRCRPPAMVCAEPRFQRRSLTEL